MKFLNLQKLLKNKCFEVTSNVSTIKLDAVLYVTLTPYTELAKYNEISHQIEFHFRNSSYD